MKNRIKLTERQKKYAICFYKFLKERDAWEKWKNNMYIQFPPTLTNKTVILYCINPLFCHRLVLGDRNYESFIDYSFWWYRTIEGEEYWNRLDNEWRAYCRNVAPSDWQ